MDDHAAILVSGSRYCHVLWKPPYSVNLAPRAASMIPPKRSTFPDVKFTVGMIIPTCCRKREREAAGRTARVETLVDIAVTLWT